MKFVRALLASANLPRDAVVLDPWNGAGTTTLAALEAGIESIGFDINPAMVVAAKARAINPRDGASLVPLAKDIIGKATADQTNKADDDPLLTWLFPEGAAALRKIEYAIQTLLLPADDQQKNLTDHRNVDKMSDIAAFFYTALFRVVRGFLQPYIPTNPTWTKQPPPDGRLHLTEPDILTTFVTQVSAMSLTLQSEQWEENALSAKTTISTNSSEALPLKDSVVDLVITSPPYCTRIDYAVATMPELAVLGYHPKGSFQELRRRMIGTSTVPPDAQDLDEAWGEECLSFLNSLKSHQSKASGTYYFKSHVQYYSSMHRSLSELIRVTKLNAQCVIVVQDSFYKEVHNNLPVVITQMLEGLGAERIGSADFQATSRMGDKHPTSAKYGNRKATESVICFRRTH